MIRPRPDLIHVLAASGLLALATACGGGGGSSSGAASAPAVVVTVTPASSSVGTGQTLVLGATVANASNTAVTWSLQEGASAGSIASNGTYTAPMAINGASITVHAVATSVADPTKTATATLTVNARTYQGTFADAATPIVPRAYSHTLTLLPNGKVLMAGGVTTGQNPQVLSQAEIYDPATNTWTAVGSMGTPRQSHAATLLPNGKVLIVGGIPILGGNSGLKTAELFDPATGTFTPTGSTAVAHEQLPTLTLSNGKALLVGGYGAAPPETYDPATGTWTSGTGTAPTYYFSHELVNLPNGKAMAMGGGSPGSLPSAGTQVFDPAANALSAGPSMADSRTGHRAFLLPNGKVLAAGGSYLVQGNNTYIPRSSAELFDPAAGSWSGTGAMAKPHSWGFGSMLSDGRVLMAAGADGAGASAETYSPATGTWSATGASKWGSMYSQAVLLKDGRVLVVGGVGSLGAQLYQ